MFVHHSLGGLAEAFNTSRNRNGYKRMSRRIPLISFLGCPQDYGNLADLLLLMVRIMLSFRERPFPSDFHPDPTLIQTVKEKFPQNCQELELNHV